MLKAPEHFHADVSSHCHACRSLEGLPTLRPPHGALVLNGQITREDGEILSYRCCSCGTFWMRFEPNCMFRGAVQRWERV